MSIWDKVPSCNNCKWDGKEINPCGNCTWENEWEPRPQTNADRIRSKTDEELAKYFTWLTDTYTFKEFKSYKGDECREKAWLVWLEQESEVET